MSRRPEPPRSVKHDWLDAVLASRSPDLDGYAVAVASALWSHMNRDGVCWPSMRLVADEAKMSPNTVVRRIEALERAGLIAVQRRRRGANTYRAVSVSQGATDERSVSPDHTDGRGRRGGSPSVSSDELSVSSQNVSVSSQNVSVSSGALSVSPGATEHVNTRRVEHENTARSGGGPDGPPALGASRLANEGELDGMEEEIKAAETYVVGLDREIGADVPDEASVRSAFRKRLVGAGYLDRRTGTVREAVTVEELIDAQQAALGLRAWCLNKHDGAPPPGWLLRTIERRQELLDKRRPVMKGGWCL